MLELSTEFINIQPQKYYSFICLFYILYELFFSFFSLLVFSFRLLFLFRAKKWKSGTHRSLFCIIFWYICVILFWQINTRIICWLRFEWFQSIAMCVWCRSAKKKSQNAHILNFHQIEKKRSEEKRWKEKRTIIDRLATNKLYFWNRKNRLNNAE